MGSKCSPMYFMGEHLLKGRCVSGRGPDTALSPFSISCESHSQAGSATIRLMQGRYPMTITEIQIAKLSLQLPLAEKLYLQLFVRRPTL